MTQFALSPPPDSSKQGVVHLFRDPDQFLRHEHQIAFATEPFLVPLGCGTCYSADRIAQVCNDAKSRGYDVFMYTKPDYKRNRFPLDDEDRTLIESLIQ